MMPHTVADLLNFNLQKYSDFNTKFFCNCLGAMLPNPHRGGLQQRFPDLTPTPTLNPLTFCFTSEWTSRLY